MELKQRTLARKDTYVILTDEVKSTDWPTEQEMV